MSCDHFRVLAVWGDGAHVGRDTHRRGREGLRTCLDLGLRSRDSFFFVSNRQTLHSGSFDGIAETSSIG